MFEMIIIYLSLGIVAGTLAGLLGIGGGVLVVPGLAWVFLHYHLAPGSVMHMACGTSLAVMVMTSSSSLHSHLKRNIEFWSIYRLFLPGIVIGVVVGALFSTWLSSRTLAMVFGVFVILIAFKMFFHRSRSGDHRLPGLPGMSGVGVVIGAKSGLLGLGGGVITIPFLTYCGVDMRKSVVVSVMVGMTIATIGALTYILTGLTSQSHLPHWSLGYVYLPAWISVATSSVLFARVGANLSHRLPVPMLKRVFAIVMLLIGIHMLQQ